jgi:signal transduction histidine kinase
MSENTVTVLLIEDNPGDVRLIGEVLSEETSARYNLVLADRLDGGLERLEKGGIDVALLDLSLPDSQGLDTFNQAHAHSPQVPIVVLTGLDDPTVAVEILHAGGQDYLNKRALDLCALDRTIRHAIERKRAEKLAPHAMALFQAVKRCEEQFFAVLSDELRTPLAPVLSKVSALLDDPTTPGEVIPTLAMIRHQVGLEARLIDELLAYSRVEARGAAFQPTDCEAVFERALDCLKPSIDESGAVVTRDPLPWLWADASQMGQLFQNLIGNAIKYRGDAPPRIRVAVEREGQEWIFSVRDNGIGFDPEHAQRIFNIFQRLHDKEEYPGTGIGLASCKKIVERHGGRIWAESEPGHGSDFFFAIPVREMGSHDCTM